VIPAGSARGRAIERDTAYLKGVLLVVAGGFFISQSGVIIALLDDPRFWNVQLYRALSAIVVLGGFTLVRHRGRLGVLFATGKLAMVSTGVCLAVSNLFYISAFFHTLAANVFLIVSSQPFFAALIGRLVLREPVRRATWLAMAAALAGVAVMVGEGAGEGRLYGNLMALGAAVTFAAFGVSLRGGRNSDMVPGVMLASVIIGTLAAFNIEGFVMSTGDVLLCVYMGAFQVSAALILYAAGARYVPAAELMVLALIEVILGPLWVWLLIGEAPQELTLIGGAVVVLAVLFNAVTGMRRRQP
jgi:drug/metabolite transporter (DMT)-like permease